MTQEDTAAMEDLQDMIISLLVLAFPLHVGKYTLDSDASTLLSVYLLLPERLTKEITNAILIAARYAEPRHIPLHRCIV